MKASKKVEFKITPEIRKEIIEIVDARIREAHVTREDFSELKQIVKELAEAQKRTESKLEAVVEEQRKLAEEQRKLAEAQRKSEEAIRRLAIGLNRLQGIVGGIGRSIGYALENEAYRMMPKVLRERYGIEVEEKLIRKEVKGKEINLLGFGKKNGLEVVIVGEAKMRLERKGVFRELEEKVKIVREEYPEREVIKVLVTHFSTKAMLEEAEKAGIIVIQSFEW
ncbi:MAG: hypothetical protein N2504_07515 [candidate division WOR-3 bacterium]|nr:hypothetical protein [candidate division WOR-3 bacterium]